MFGLPRLHLLNPADLPDLPTCPDCGFSPAADAQWARAAQDRWSLVGVGFFLTPGPPAYALVGLPESVPGDHPLFGQKP